MNTDDTILMQLSRIEAKLDNFCKRKEQKSEDENKVKIGSNEYTLKKLPDGKVWMMENLREEVEGAVWNDRYRCYMYTFDEAQKAVPEGFHLPSAREFFKLALALGYLEKDETVAMNRFIKECGFALTGHVSYTGVMVNQGHYGFYWSSTQSGETFGYCLYFDSTGVNPVNDYCKTLGMAVRLIKD